MSPDDIWRAIDRLAAKNGLSPSGLAKRAGLNLTTFNRGKRYIAQGRTRWINLETLYKVLNATNTSLADFIKLMEPPSAKR